MHKTTITFTVLSEDPIPNRLDIADVVWECDQGGYVLVDAERLAVELSGKQMADALKEAGSDPGFFMLDDEGEKVDE